MAKFGQSQLLQGARNPAAPAGLRQTSQRLATQQQQYDSGASRLRPWQPESSMLETAKSWYTGANQESTRNGWDTTFYNNAYHQYDQFQKKAMEANKGSVFYDWLDPVKNPQATGVTTWGADPNDQGAKDRGETRFGDVYNNGKKVANLYDDYDKATADVMAGEFLFSDDEKKSMFAHPGVGPDGKPVLSPEYGAEVEKRRVENTDRKLYAKSAEDYDSNVKAREVDLRKGWGDEAVIGGGIAGGALLGAGIGFAVGSAVPIIGNAVGAVVGGVVGGIAGGVGSGLNQDQLVEMTARSQEKADIANEKLGANWLQKTTMQIGEYSQLGQKFISPVSNLWQGAQDARLGKVGDMTSEFYAVDDQGNRRVGVVTRGADIAATLADSVLQFGSPVGRWAYMGSMTGVVAGKVAEMTTGSVFNEKRGEYDELNGWQEWVPAIGSTAIDAAQVGVAGAFTKAARASRAAFAGSAGLKESAGATGAFAAEDAAGPVTRQLDKGWAKLKGTEVGAKGVNINGMRFMTDEAGKVVTSRPTLELLAPSEFLRWLPSGFHARRLARIDGGEVTRDHLMQASMNLMGSSGVRDALLLGYSEGGEEAIQAYLDPQRTGDKATMGQVFEAYLYGAASGAGMGLGPQNRSANTQQQLEAQAHFQHSMRTGTTMTKDEWQAFTKANNWTKTDFENAAKTSPLENKQTQDVLSTLARQQRQERAYHSSIGYARMEQIKMGKFESTRKKALEEGNGSLVLMGQTSEFLVTPSGRLEKNKFAANAGVMSAYETTKQLDLISKGQQAQLDDAQNNIRLAEQARDSAEAGSDAHAAAESQLSRLSARIPELRQQIQVSRQVSDKILTLYRNSVADTNPNNRRAHIDGMNALLQRAYTGQWTDNNNALLPAETQAMVQRAVEMKVGRYPFIDRGSFALVMPQISAELTDMDAHSTLYLQQGMLKSMGADHDGDTVVPLHTLYSDTDNLNRMRRGDQYMQPTEDPETKRTTVEVIVDPPDGEGAFLQAFADAMLDSTSRSAQTVTTRLSALTTAIKREFSAASGGPLDASALDDLLTTFRDAVLEGRVDARKTLVTAMVNLDYPGFRNHQNSDNVPNVLWLWTKINETWDILQKDLAHLRSTESTTVPIEPQREAQETKIRSELARARAATASADLGLLASDPVRGAQFLHYSALFRSLTEVDPDAVWTTDMQLDLTRLFMQLGAGQTAKDIDLLTGRNAVEERVYYWLSQMAKSTVNTADSAAETMLLLSNLSVPAVKMVAPNEYQVEKGQITMLQLLLRRSLDIEEARNPAKEPDSDEAKRLKKLRGLTYRDPDRSKHSYTASLAMIEVMGNRPLYELIGSSSSYIAPQITLNQLVGQQRGLHPDVRNDENYRLAHQPAYLKDTKNTYKDAPWPLEALTGGGINAYAMLVDAVKVAGDTYVPAMRGRDATVQKNFIDGLAGLHQMMETHRQTHGKELARDTSTIDKVDLLRDMLARDQKLAMEIGKLIPDAAALGVFEVHDDNTVTQARWLEEMLTTEDYERAAAIYYFQVKLADFNVRGGTVDMNLSDRLQDSSFDRDGLIDLGDVRGRIDPTSLKSRFQQIMFHLASQPDGIELFRFLKAMHEAPSTKAMFEMINNEPAWRNNQAELLPWHDDVADFEFNPEDVWTGQMDGSLQRENIRGWGQRMQILGSEAVEAEANDKANKSLLHAMSQWVNTRGTANEVNSHDARLYVGLLKKAIENRKRFPDTQGQVARTQLVELQQMGLAAVQNKGRADPKAAPYGEPLITLDSFGWSDGLRQEIAAVTAEDTEDVLTNLTLLTDGPVRIMLEDGSNLEFDITDEEKALRALQDPRTQNLAISILFPTVRDVNTNNVVQTYLDTDSKGSIAKMLQEQNHTHLFHEYTVFSERLQQAHRYIGLLEGYVRKGVLGSQDQAQLDAAYMPIQQAVHDIITAYLHSMDVEERDFATTRDRLFIDVADAIKAVAAVDPVNRPQLREIIAATLSERFQQDRTKLDRLLQDGTIRESFLQLEMLKRESKIRDDVLADFDARILQATDDTEQIAIEAEMDAWILASNDALGQKLGYPAQTFLDAAAALRMFTLTGDPGTDDLIRSDIISFLGRQNRLSKLLKKGNQGLYYKMLRLYDENPVSPQLDSDEWETLGAWCAELYLFDTTSRSSSSVPATAAMKGDDGANLQRYFDQSWLYLTDALFDPKILEGADLLAQDSTYTKQQDTAEVAKMLTDGLLSDKRLGTWTEVIVNESMKARMILKNSAVGAAVAQEGNDPKALADYIGAGMVTWERPEEAHFTPAVLNGSKDQRLGDLLADDLAHVKLENHFVRKVVIQNADPANPLDPAVADSLSAVTSVNQTSAETEAAGQIRPGADALRVLDLAELDARIEWLKSNHNLADYTVEIEYVDVNKKPFERKWANNIFFDGAGREAKGGSGLGAVASLFFGLNGLSKVGQQNPLDMATKHGMGFKAHKRSALTTTQALEANGASVSEILAAKAVHLLQQKYPMGPLLRADLPSMYKLMKMRHVIVGYNAQGEKEVWWPEQYITHEEAGTPITLQNVKLVALSDRVAQTLWGRSGAMGTKGTPGSLVRPTFNIQSLNTFPLLTREFLRTRGLERLGETTELGNSRLAQVSKPSRATARDDKGKPYTSLYKQRLMAWRGEMLKVSTARSSQRHEGAGKLDVERIVKDNAQLIINMLDAETQAVTARSLGMPEQGLVDLSALQVSRWLAANLSKQMETSNSMIWVHRHGLDGDLTRGYAGRAGIQDNFAGFNGKGPTYGDIVVIDLSDILATTDIKDYQDAAEEARRVIKAYAKLGVTVSLQTTRGQFDLRAKVVADLTDGSLGYRPMAESAHFFVPITEASDYNAAQRALASTLLETSQFTTRNVALRFVADGVSTNLTEGTEYIDIPNDQAIRTVSHTLLPFQMMSTGSVGRRIPFSFNVPQTGSGRADQMSKVNSQLLELLTSRSGRDYLKELLGGDNGNYPKYIEHPNGTIQNGVLPLDDALDNLQRTIEGQAWPLDVGQTFYWGTIVPLVSGDGSIHLSRIGFKQPTHRHLTRQRELRFNDQPLKITGTRGRLDDKQTLPPPTVVDEVRADAKGLSVIGTYAPGKMAKMISEGIGLKSGFAPMPKGYRFPNAAIKAVGAVGMRVSRIMGSTSVIGKEAKAGLVNNFRDAFAVTGVNFEDDMIDFFFGGDPTTRSDEERARLWDLTQTILKQWAATPHPYTAVELSRVLDSRSEMALMQAQFNALGKSVAGDVWRPVSLYEQSLSPQDPKDRLATIILATLAAPGVQVEHVISTPGITTVANHDNGSLVRLMPALMTDALNDMDHPELRKLLIARMNRNMPTDGGRALYWFDNQLKFHARMEQDVSGKTRDEEIVGHLQIHVPLPADENAIRQEHAGIESGGLESKHIADTMAGAIGGEQATKTRKKGERNIPDALDEIYGDNEIERFEDDETAAASFYYMLTRLKTDAETYSPWSRRTSMEEVHYDKAQAKVRQYLIPGERTKENGWSPSQKIEGDRLATSFLAKLNIRDPKATADVEVLVRQLFGIPGPARDQEDYPEHLTFDVFQSGLEYMSRNIDRGKHPLEGGYVPLEHEMFWRKIFDAQKGLPKDKQWLPLMNDNKVKEYAQADSWVDWVNALHGQMRESHEMFNSRFRLDLDGFYHTYQGTHPDYMEMTLSTDEQIAAKLLDPDVNRPIASVDPGQDAVLRDPIVLASQYLTYDALVGKGAVISLEDAEEASGSVVAKRIAAIEAWQRGEGLPKQKDMSVKEYAKQGAAYQESKRTTSTLMRNLVNASVMTRLFNPALYVSAMFEVPFRSAIENITNVMTGQLTGVPGKAAAGVGTWLERGLNKGDDQWWLSKKLEVDGVKVAPRYSVDDINRLGALNSSLGESNRFLGLVYGELAYQSVIGGGRGRIGGALESGAAFAARATADPWWGMKATSLAKRYNDAAWEYLSMTSSKITIEQYAHEMMQDPNWLFKNDPVAHKMGLNAVKQARGAKATMLGNGLMRPVEQMMKSKNLLLQGSGTLLKLPFLFTRFNANMMIALTGLHGLDQMAAMFFDGRQKPQILKRLANRAKLGEFDVNTPEYWDNSDVIESIDLSRAFVRGAVTQTGLMSLAMLAHGFSLGGEDEEERRRKRLATYLNTPYYHDPNKASNDFRWTDAIFLDNVPVLSNIFMNETGHAAVVPHWIFRQFLSPVLGMMRFFETGDVLQITHGFRDAASVLPNSVARLWSDADLTTQLLMDAADNDELIPEKQTATRQLFTNIVFMYEKALVENAFINGLYQAADEFDRNPWAIAKTDATGHIVREQGTGRPEPTDALQAYQTGEGTETSNRVGYATRKGMDGLLHQYAEGNATAAVILSLIPWVQGQDSTFLRGNMVTKRQRVQTDETPKAEIEALLYSTYEGRGGQPFLTKEEIIGAIKQREQAAGRFWDQAKVEAEADAVYSAYAERPLTVFDNGGKEVMTLDGKTGVFRSLRDGVIDLDNPAIAGFNITQAERNQIAEELVHELIQEGVDAGLSDQSAMYRMRRIWYGDPTNPSAPGLREILYDKRIPDKPYTEYEQQNVTYVLGPDGKPWATPFSKANVLQVLGIPLPHQMAPTIPGVTSLDERGNVIDLIRGTNTGLAAVVPRPVTNEVKANDDAVKKAEARTYTPGGKYTPFHYNRFPWRNFGRRSFGRRGGGGGGGFGGGGGSPFFQKLMALPQGTSARMDTIQSINTSNPIIRRADVRRERITSERGRLKQWQ